MKKPKSLEEIKASRKPVINTSVVLKQKLTRIDRLALWITEHVGTMGFFLIIFVWTLLWLGWNALGPTHLRFDPYPGFVLWLFISNMIQIFLMPLIMVGQNLQSQHAEIRAESDFEVNVKAENEVEAILMHLEFQNSQIEEILRRIEQK